MKNIDFHFVEVGKLEIVEETIVNKAIKIWEVLQCQRKMLLGDICCFY